MTNDALYYGLLGMLAIALLAAAFTDLRERRIGNRLNAAVALGAPVYWWAAGFSLWPEVALQIGFAVLVAAVLIGLWSLKFIGGGDIKLLGALALWITPWSYGTLLIVMALVGGLLTILIAAFHVAARRKGRPVIPYGVAIAAGGLWVLGIDMAGLTGV
ncbi:peptidase [Erythrobacteraceae bacterium CFH 75059]|uniref:A24 family peptidase n=1 Tax=Qipengyuania thermophila TaxID=2509361 RepID=UPI00102293B9|nr:prepilin peptidase [Qipengyuania thermophila]TCD06218.1 peptidase [Erythrobacteraceae bacterium CFH 75059]